MWANRAKAGHLRDWGAWGVFLEESHILGEAWGDGGVGEVQGWETGFQANGGNDVCKAKDGRERTRHPRIALPPG